MRRRIFALAFAALPILAGITIASVKIARADINGTCIYNAVVSPIAGYPTLPGCDSGRRLGIAIKYDGGTSEAGVLQMNGDALNASTPGLISGAFAYGFNGASWDRLTTTAQVGSTGILRTALCNSQCALITGTPTDGLATASPVLGTASLSYGFNGATWDRLRARAGEIQTTDGGAVRTKATSTTCVSATASAGVLHRVVAAGAETATLTIYDEGASPTCSAADIIYNKVPPNGTADSVDIPVNNGTAYKLSAAAAVNDYITTN